MPAYVAGTLNTRQPTPTPQITPAKVSRAIQYHNSRFSSRSTLLIQNYVNANPDGKFGPLTAQAVARFQHRKGGRIGVDGMVGKDTLNVFLKNPPAGHPMWRTELIHLVAECYGVDVESDTLSLRYDRNVGVLHTTGMSQIKPQAGGLRVVHIGPQAFTSIDVLRQVIEDAMLPPVLALGTTSPTPQRLGKVPQQAALAFNKARLQDHRAIKVVQYLAGASQSGFLDADTVQRIAEFQHREGIPVDGRITDKETLPRFVTTLMQAISHDAALRLIVDYYNMKAGNTVMDISYDPNIRTMGRFSGWTGGPIIIRIGVLAFQQDFPGLVHSVAHYFARTEARRTGTTNIHALKFIGEVTEILSRGMRPEKVDRFYLDAARAWNEWGRINDRALYRQLWPKFKAIRKVVVKRLDSANVEAQKYLANHPNRRQDFFRVVQNYQSVLRP